LAVMNGDDCPAEEFMLNGEKSTEAARFGLLKLLEYVASNGLQPAKWWHEADKELEIFEFIKGPLRFFFFKGKGNDIAVCISGVRKKTQKADKRSVQNAAEWRNAYFEALNNSELEVVTDEN